MEKSSQPRYGLSGIIRELRSELKISKSELARMLGVSVQLIDKWEADPTRELVDKMIGICHRHGLHRIARDLAGDTITDNSGITGDCVAYLRFKSYAPHTSQGKALKSLILDTIAAFATETPSKDLGLF